MLSIRSFIGEVPAVTPRLLPDGGAQVAINCRMIDGAIVPLRYPTGYRSLLGGNVMFFKSGDKWFEYNKLIDVVQAPIAEDRLYFTGDGKPKIVVDASIYDLAVESPKAALTASTTGTTDPDTEISITYVYTYITASDEESEPSPLSNEVLVSYGMEVTLTGFRAPTGNRNYDRIRIYRSQTSASGRTDLYFVFEIPLPVPSSYADDPWSIDVQEAITSTDFNPPPDDLQGIIALPNGMLAGFVENRLYLSEPWKPHAWPEKYILTTSFDIVGLGAFGRSIAIMTTGNPYVASGVTPDAMSMELIEVNYPCVSKRGIVDLGYAVAYPSTDGLIVISGNGANLVTKKLFTRGQWQKLNPGSMIASQSYGRYVVRYSSIDSSAELQNGTLIIDMTGDTPFISRINTFYDYMFFEVGSGILYVLDGRDVIEFDSIYAGYMNFEWKSKPFILDGHTNYGAILVDSDAAAEDAEGVIPYVYVEEATLGSGSYFDIIVNGKAIGESIEGEFNATVYADGVAVRTTSDLNAISRLPGGFLARTWEVEINARRIVNAIHLAWSPSELSIGFK